MGEICQGKQMGKSQKHIKLENQQNNQFVCCVAHVRVSPK